MARYRSNLSLGTSGLEDFSAATKALTKINRDLPRDFKNSVTTTAKELRDLARIRALQEPAAGKSGSTGLRADVAKGVGIVQIKDGVRVVTSMPNRNEAIIPRGMDGIKGWRHPVFGNKNNWVRQTSGTESWFLDTMRDGHTPLRERLERNLQDAADTVDNAS